MCISMKFLTGVLCLLLFNKVTSAQFFQYFYSSPTPIVSPFPSTFYPSQIIPQPQPYYAQPEFYQPQSAARQIPTPASPIQKNHFATSPASENYRGFGYHTNFQDGASSTVVFFTGGTPNFYSSNNLRGRLTTVASDSLDPQAPKGIEDRLRNIFEGNQVADKRDETSKAPNNLAFPSLTPLIKTFLEQPESLNQVVHFYSAPGFPANTSPLLSGRSRSLNFENLNSTTNTTTKSLKEETPAESILSTTLLRNNKERDSNSTNVGPGNEGTLLVKDQSQKETNKEMAVLHELENSTETNKVSSTEIFPKTKERKSEDTEDKNISTTDISEDTVTTAMP